MSPTTGGRLKVDRPRSLYDEELSIEADSLVPGKDYVFRLRLFHSEGTHHSSAKYTATADGTIALWRDFPKQSSTSCIAAMGLFWALEAGDDCRKGSIVWATPATTVFRYQLDLVDENERLVDSVKLEKHWLHPDVERIEIDDQSLGVLGVVFKPKGAGPFPTVLDLNGTGGGIREHRGAALAAKGFAAMCLPYFRLKWLPNELTDVNVEYFDNAIRWLLSQPYTSSDSLGILGSSFGGYLALLLSTRCDKVTAVCAMNPAHALNEITVIREGGQPMPHGSLGPIDFDKGVYIGKRSIGEMTVPKEAEFRFERARKDCRYLLLMSQDDVSSDPLVSCKFAERLLKDVGREVEILSVTGGHQIEPPPMPHIYSVFTRMGNVDMLMGGTVAENGRAQEHSWRRIVRHFGRAVGKARPLELPFDENERSKL